MFVRVPLLAALGLSLVACSSSSTGTHGGGGGSGSSGGGGGSNGGGGGVVSSGGSGSSGGGGSVGGGGDDGGSASATMLTLVIRDFKFYASGDSTTNPDFENVPTTGTEWPDKDIVTDTLGSDRKPVYKGVNGSTLTTHGASAFNQWYNDTPTINLNVHWPLPLTAYPDGTYGYDSSASGVEYDPNATGNKMFFPIDDGTPYATAFGDQGKPHNYSFTAEAHTTFTYNGGETFSYRGDDDVFVYIDGKLQANLGGIHNPETSDISLDSLGLTKGNVYPLDFFFAERHVYGSNVKFTTTLKLQQAPIT